MSAHPIPSEPDPSPKIPPGAINLSPLLRGYEGKWVALRKDYSAVVASGENHTDCSDAVKAKEGTLSAVIFLRIPPKGVGLLY